MKISNGIKKEYNYKTTYKILYKQIKEEIKNIAIDRYINQIEYLSKKVEKLNNENLLLKNDFIYILKRVLLYKNDNNGFSSSQNSNIYRSNQIKNIYSIKGLNGINNNSILNSNNNNISNSYFSSGDSIHNDNNRFGYNFKYRKINNSINKMPLDERRYSIDDDFRKGNNSSVSPVETSKQVNMQNKIDYYLNSLYKHHFAEECIAGTSSVHLLNKNQSIYDELFTHKINSNKNKVLRHINTDINYIKISTSKSKNNSRKKKLSNNDANNANDNKSLNKKNDGKIHRFKKNKTNGILRVKRKEEFTNSKSKINENNIGKKNKYGYKSSTTINVNPPARSSKIISSNMCNRSPFLINKF